MKSPVQHCITYGCVARRLDANGFVVSECIHAGGVVLPSHAHAPATICFVMRGGYREAYGRSEVACEPGMLIGKRAADEHANAVGPEGARSFTLEVERSRLDALGEAATVLDHAFVVSGGSAVSAAWRLAGELDCVDELSPLMIESAALELLAALARGPRGPRYVGSPAWLGVVRDALHDAPRTGWSLHALAGLAGVHAVHLAREFRRRFGCSIGEYVRARRVAQVQRRLRDGNEPISQIAIDLGFSDQSHLTREFRAATGVAPAAYRRRVRG